MGFDAVAGIADLVEHMHRTVQLRPGPFGRVAQDRPGGITGLVYRLVGSGIRLTGQAVDAGLSPVAALLPQDEPGPGQLAFRSALNGIYGDYLRRTGNPLAIGMSLRCLGRAIDPADPAAGFAGLPSLPTSDRLLLLVHGLCMNDLQWQRLGHDHGMALASELGFTPVYLRYNSGLPVADNGRELAGMLETLAANWPRPLSELVVIGHSMGGLVARSAVHHATTAGHAWPGLLRKLLFLGTPHHGAPLERGGHLVDLVMGLSPYSAPFTRIGNARSAGITDLRRGSITPVPGERVPLPAGVRCYAAAASLGSRRGIVSERLVGDGLVPVGSALGRHPASGCSLDIPPPRQWVGNRMGHLELLHRPEVFEQLRGWMQESD